MGLAGDLEDGDMSQWDAYLPRIVRYTREIPTHRYTERIYNWLTKEWGSQKGPWALQAAGHEVSAHIP